MIVAVLFLGSILEGQGRSTSPDEGELLYFIELYESSLCIERV